MKIVGMMAVYNESDMVGESLGHLISQGIPVVVLDNGSTDGSYEILSEFLGKGVLSLRRIATERFELQMLLRKLHEMSLEFNPEWQVLCDADELLESSCRSLTLKEVIQREDREGYNLIQFDNFEFWPTEIDQSSQEKSVRKRLRYYTWNDDFHFRAWKSYAGMNIDAGGGHFPDFPIDREVKVSPRKCVMRHYRIRSYEHGLRKIFEERLPRYPIEELSMGWHRQYSNFRRDRACYIVDSRKLTRYEEDGRWSRSRTFDPSSGRAPGPSVHSRIAVLQRKLDEGFERIRRLEEHTGGEEDRRGEILQQIQLADPLIQELKAEATGFGSERVHLLNELRRKEARLDEIRRNFDRQTSHAGT